MDYFSSRQRIITEFKKHPILGVVRNRDFNSIQFHVEPLTNGTTISIWFPGYKTNIEKGFFDYRVNIQTQGQKNSIALSHVNIIVDIYNKCRYNQVPQNEMRIFLQNIIKEGEINPYQNTSQLENFMPDAPPSSSDLLDKISTVHKKIGKDYQREGNTWNYSFEELANSIKWIALQEDINYPISNGKQGRRMPFSRYLEAIEVSERSEHNLGEVIKRALAHGRPPEDWPGINYQEIIRHAS